MAEMRGSQSMASLYSDFSDTSSLSSERDDSTSCNLPGIVAALKEKYGFIRPTVDLPVGFKEKDVFFPSRLAQVRVGDLVRFHLVANSPDKPRAYRVWLDGNNNNRKGQVNGSTGFKEGRISGVIVAKKQDYGFIKPLENLPEGFLPKDVYVSCRKAEFEEGDMVTFILRRGSEGRPEAHRVWVIKDSQEDVPGLPANDATYEQPMFKKPRIVSNQGQKNASNKGKESEINSNSVYLQGQVVKISDKFGFIKCTDKLPQDHINGDIYFEVGSTEVDLHDTVEFQLRENAKGPAACNVRRVSCSKAEPRRRIPEIKRVLGVIIHMNGEHGALKVIGDGLEDFKAHRIYFQKKWVRSGGMDVIIGDQVEFTLSESKRREDEMTATKIKLVKAKVRSPQAVSDYIAEIMTVLDKGNEPHDFILNIIGCTAVWECIGRTWAMTDQTISELLSLLLLISKKSQTLSENFKQMLATVANSELCSSSNGVLKIFIKNAWIQNNHEHKQKLMDLFILIVDLLPEKARTIVALSREMLPLDKSDTSHFFYSILKKVASNDLTSVSDLEWDELPLVPGTAEILKGPLESQLHLNPVRVTGPYESTVDYIDTYYRLLRTDCFNALCVGIKQFLQQNLDPRDMNIYTGVQLKGIHIMDSGDGIALAMKVKPPKPIKNWETCSNLMFGNLLCFSPSGKFDNPIWATVLKRDAKLLKSEQIIWVQLCSECNQRDDTSCLASMYEASGSIILAESPTYYLAYQPVLRAIQGMQPDNLAFQEELVEMKGSKEPDYAIHVEEMQTTMDQSQRNAFDLALNSRLAVIQGPPGTGKTFIGLKLVKTILKSSSGLRLPVLVLTYKNHALDEFLKELLEIFPNEVARVGGRCQDPDLKQINLQELRSKHSRSDTNFKKRIELKDDLAIIKKKLEANVRHLGKTMHLSIETLLFGLDELQLRNLILGKPREWSKKGNKTNNEELPRERIQQLWLENKATLFDENLSIQARRYGINTELGKIMQDILESWAPSKDIFYQILRSDERLSQVLIRQAKKEDSHNDNGDKKSADTGDEVDIEDIQKERLAAYSNNNDKLEMTVKFDQVHTGKLPSIMPYAKRLAEQIPLVSVKGISELWSLEDYDRAVIIQVLLYHHRNRIEEEVKLDFESYKTLMAAIKELDNQNNVAILQSKKVVGMTITGASIHNQLLQALRPAIIVVEEAAEVLEPQLIAVLGDWVKHLILIGDHMQLKPGVETYELVRNYHFDVSMMERLINNNYPYTSLQLQNRMRPEMAELLLDIYPKLKSNTPRVLQNKPPNFIPSSLFFWDHEDEESSNEQNRSIVNKLEAERAIRLALLFIQQGFQPSQITILGAYQGHVSLLRKMYKEMEGTNSHLFQQEDDGRVSSESKVKIHTIDMYQGDENDILIVSLVRSNKAGKLGFLKALNRRCVAQSRAKCGMIFIGNKETLMSQGSPWVKVIQSMLSQQQVDKGLPLQCPFHLLYKPTRAIKASDISLDGLCKRPCVQKMECGKHACKKLCQPYHTHSAHLCVEMVDFVHSVCGHPGKRQCSTPESQVPCLKPCPSKMQCRYKHDCPRDCQPQHSHLPNYCEVKVAIILDKCGHQAIKSCGEEQRNIKCVVRIPFRFSSCGHVGRRKCTQTENEILCSEKCPRKLECGHPCEEFCGQKCDKNKCKVCEEKRRIEQKKQREAEKRVRDVALQNVKRELEALNKVSFGGYYRVDLKPEGDTTAEYYDVEDRVKKYIQPGHGWFPQVERIEKVINVSLQKKWLEAKLKMFDPTRSELKFHGTGEAGVQGIIKEGFRLSSPQGNMYGGGVYFATDASKSAQHLYTKGSNKLLLCDVLLGRSLTVNKAMPTMDSATLKKQGYDSLYAKRDTKQTGGVYFDEFVVYDGAQALPKYVIHYKSVGSQHILSLTPTVSLASGIQSIKLRPKRQYNPKDTNDLHFRLAESQFHRLTKHNGMAADVKEVELYTNPTLAHKFEAKRKEFALTYPGSSDKDSVLAFHGTPTEDNIDKIMKENFRMDRCKSGAYGAGIYFSEFPVTSMGYASSLRKLILCEVLPGRTFPVAGSMNNAPLQTGYDSHTVSPDDKGRAQMIVIYNSDQILPKYVISF